MLNMTSFRTYQNHYHFTTDRFLSAGNERKSGGHGESYPVTRPVARIFRMGERGGGGCIPQESGPNN